jgi:hypothetical protein
VLILFLIKPPAATGQPHSSATFACPANSLGEEKYRRKPKPFWLFDNWPRRPRRAKPAALGALSWTEIRLHCTASIGRSPSAACGSARRNHLTTSERWDLPLSPNLSIQDLERAKSEAAAFLNQV